METLIIGAGMSGLRAATSLQEAGHRVTVVDKGRRHGGRMATRRVDDAVFDTGVLDFAARSTTLRTQLERAEAEGHAARVGNDGPDGRWRGAPMMRSLPTAIAERAGADHSTLPPVAVQLASTVTGISVDQGRWTVTITRDGAVERRAADALVITAPAPQTLALLRSGDALASDATLARLEAVTYDPSLTVLVRPVDRSLRDVARAVGSAAAHTNRPVGTDLLRLHHNGRSGASPVVALTLQASATFSAQHLDGDRDAAATALAEQASELVGTALEVVHVHGWRYAQVTRPVALPALRDDTSGVPLVLAGDLFEAENDASDGTPAEGVERASLSGRAAAALLTGLTDSTDSTEERLTTT